MKVKNKFYVTTPIYYPNDIPHVGHAYTTIAADVVARWNKLNGKEVFFLTGTDEHGKKIERTAEKQGKKPRGFVDELVPKFKDAWNKLYIEYDRFLRTTDADHEKVVKAVLKKVYDNGDIYLGEYEGLYCTGCEAYYTEKDLQDGSLCPIHKTKVEVLKEPSYFFKLSKYREKLLKFYKDNPDFILPRWRTKEIINRLNEGLNDLSISRTSFDWGIKLPFDNQHIVYVWFDALLNYITGVGFLDDKKKFEKFWPADIQFVAKDIMWFHVVIWPAMLMSAGIELPKSIFIHGYWTFNNEKISKSRGKVINIDELIKIAGVDSARYFLFRSTPFGEDGDFSEEALKKRHNDELANKLGNLVSRVSGLIEKYGLKQQENKLSEKLDVKKISWLMENYEFDKALNEIFAFVDICNEHIQNAKPWSESCPDREKVLYELADSIKSFSILLWPFIPSSSEKIAQQFGFSVGENTFTELEKPLNEENKIKKKEILFEKV